MLHAVIMAGGSGSRFWPQSTKQHPKQFLNIFGNRTMLQNTVDRIRDKISAERLWVITNDRYVNLVQQQLPEVPVKNIIGEAVAKNTAPCVAIAAALIKNNDPEATILVLPADHQIGEPKKFLSIVDAAFEKANQSDALVTIGIEPEHPETGYGYIEFEEDSSELYEGSSIKKVAQFREKPDEDTAKKFIASGNFLWNSGMFIWKGSTILNQFKKHQAEIYGLIRKAGPDLGTSRQKKAIDEFYQRCPSISVDYGIMEQADSVFVVPGSFGWNDVGSWSAVYELRDKDEHGNAVQTDTAVLVDSKNNLVKSGSGKMIALAGVQDLAIVETEGAILVCNLNQAQDVKKIVNQLGENEETEKFL